MKDQIINFLRDANNEHYWNILSVLLTAFTSIGALIGWIINNNRTKTSKILIKSAVEFYLNWVKVRSQEQQVSNESIKNWVSENDGGVHLGRSYFVFKKFLKELKKQGYKQLIKPDELTFNNWINNADSMPKWSRVEF